jgi:hypothetical protein
MLINNAGDQLIPRSILLGVLTTQLCPLLLWRIFDGLYHFEGGVGDIFVFPNANHMPSTVY